jgi:hypothetical protein
LGVSKPKGLQRIDEIGSFRPYTHLPLYTVNISICSVDYFCCGSHAFVDFVHMLPSNENGNLKIMKILKFKRFVYYEQSGCLEMVKICIYNIIKNSWHRVTCMWRIMLFLQIYHVVTCQWRGASERSILNQIGLRYGV